MKDSFSASRAVKGSGVRTFELETPFRGWKWDSGVRTCGEQGPDCGLDRMVSRSWAGWGLTTFPEHMEVISGLDSILCFLSSCSDGASGLELGVTRCVPLEHDCVRHSWPWLVAEMVGAQRQFFIQGSSDMSRQ